MPNIKTIALARVSSKAQEDEGYSLDAQLKLIRSYCKDKKLDVISEFRISETASKNEQRSVFRQMLTYISKNNVAHLVVEKTDRLTRNLRDAVVIDDWLEKNEQRRLHMVKENLIVHKNARSDAKLMWNIYLAFAKKYTDNLREEAMKGWNEKLAQGWMPASPPPGYKTVTQNYKKIHIINDETEFLVQACFRLYMRPSQNIGTVADEAAQCGLTTRKGRPLSNSAIHRMLRNPFYIGIIRFNGRDYPGAHEPLIDKDLFWAVQEKLGEKSQSKTVRHDPLFKGLLKCNGCGSMITWQKQKGRHYGSCQRRNDSCKQYPLMRQDRLEDLMSTELQKVDEIDANREIFFKLTQKIEKNRYPYIGQHRLSVMKLIKRQIRRCELMEDNLYEDKLAGIIGVQTYQAKMHEIRERLGQLNNRLRRIQAIEDNTKVFDTNAATIVGLYSSESKSGKRIVLASLFKISVDKGVVVFMRTMKSHAPVH